MADKDRLLAIKELNITAIDDSALDVYMVELFFFCDTLPSHRESINMVLEAKQYDAFLELFEILKAFLINIHATGLAEKCQVLIDELRGALQSGTPVNHQRLISDTTHFFTALDSLYVDILVAGYIVEHASKNAQAPRPPKKGDRVMAIDDAKFYLHKVQLYFKDTRYKFTCVYDAQEAMDHFKNPDEEPFDLFLLDTDLPDMSGYELAKEIRDAGLDSPIIFLIGDPSRKTIVKALEAGAADLILKSCTKDQMIQKIRKHLQV